MRNSVRRSRAHLAHFVFSRWGRTGTRGQASSEGPFDEADEAAVWSDEDEDGGGGGDRGGDGGGDDIEDGAQGHEALPPTPPPETRDAAEPMPATIVDAS